MPPGRSRRPHRFKSHIWPSDLSAPVAQLDRASELRIRPGHFTLRDTPSLEETGNPCAPRVSCVQADLVDYSGVALNLRDSGRKCPTYAQLFWTRQGRVFCDFDLGRETFARLVTGKDSAAAAVPNWLAKSYQFPLQGRALLGGPINCCEEPDLRLAQCTPNGNALVAAHPRLTFEGSADHLDTMRELMEGQGRLTERRCAPRRGKNG
jgi:hypothetical protein